MWRQLAWTLAPFALIWVTALCVSPVRRAWGDGVRCLVSHPILWKLPAAFALAYGLFDLAAEVLLRARLDMRLLPPMLPDEAEALPAWGSLVLDGLLPGAERLAAALNCLVATFPISVLCALGFMLNWNDVIRELSRALRRRTGAWRFVLLTGLWLCAAAALIKPGLFVFLPELSGKFSGRELFIGGAVLNAMAFVFEYLLGACLQVYLVLTAYGWVRGKYFPPEKVLPFAVRRLGFVVKWALVIVVLSLILLHLPPLAASAIAGEPVPPYFEEILRGFLAAGMLACATVPIRLALHNDSLRAALAAHGKFLRRHALSTTIFLLAALGLFILLGAAQSAGARAWEGSLAGKAWALSLQIVAAAAGGWILAAWVCFYKNRESQPVK